ncbi:MAG TPA: peptidase S41 [Brevundimonas sp.]|nr:peptidase S41 [Brevundimonas sp.]
MTRLSRLAPALVALLAAPSVLAKEPTAAPADWGVALAEDARAFRDVIADSHPGPVDVENPGFNARLDAGLALALQRAETADSYEHWYFAMQAFVASFDDGHLGLTDWAAMGHRWTADWPGFLTGLRVDDGDERHEVVFRQDEAAPPLGAVLVGCDGRPAEALAAETIGRGAGRWSMASRRAAYAGALFVDQHNPWIDRPEQCDFRVGDAVRRYALNWRNLPDEVRDAGFAAARSPRFTTGIELRPWSGGQWISLGGFNGDPASADGVALTALTAEVAARADEIRSAPAVVFDLRGNNGGSSSWIYGLARGLWGEDHVGWRQPESSAVDWRASEKNLAAVEGYKTLLGPDPEVQAWLGKISTGLTAARAAGEPLWRQADDEPPAVEPATPTPMQARTWVLTDSGCASACLDAVDLLKALGAVHLGQETSGDTVYMEIREEPLPGGRVTARVPMKVYRGRMRGNNETYVPAHAWKGELADTAGIEAWIAGLDAAAARR